MAAYVDPYERYKNKEKWNPLADFMEQLDERALIEADEFEQEEARKAAKKKRDEVEKNKPKKNRNWLEKGFDQVNPFDNARTWKEDEAQNDKTFMEQAGDVGGTIFSGVEKVGDSVEALTGIAERRQRGWDEERQKRLQEIDKQFGEDYDNPERYKMKKQVWDDYNAKLQGAMDDTAWAGDGRKEDGTIDQGFSADRFKKAAGVSLEATSEIVPFLKAGKAAQLTTKGGAAFGAATGAAHGLGGEMNSEDGDIDLANVGLETLIGGVAGGGFGRLAERSAARGASNAASKAALQEQQFMDDLNAGRITDPKRMLPSGEDTMRNRLQEIDDELEAYRTGGADATEFSPDAKTMDTLGTDRVSTGGAVRTNGEPDMRLNANKNRGEFSPEAGTTQPTKTPEELRGLMRERQRLEAEIDGLESIKDLPQMKAGRIDHSDPMTASAVENELKAIDQAGTDAVTGKINYLTDYFRTPTTVLRKIGLGKTADTVERSFEGYRREFADVTSKVSEWRKAVGKDPEATKRIFAALEGDNVPLNPTEQKIFTEMKQGFEEYADRLGIPKENRISDYVTHIFDKDFKGDSLDPMLARILERQPTGRVYNPFTKQRLGAKGYKEDAFEAFEVYSKRAAREVHMNPSLKLLADAAGDANVDGKTADYILNFSDRVAMKPAKLDRALNHLVESIPGVTEGTNAGVRAAQAWRNNIYRATLGLNVSSAVRNLTQSSNTFAELGVRDTVAGYSKILRAIGQQPRAKMGSGSQELMDELYRVGVLDDSIRKQDEQFMSLKKGIQKADPVLWAMFDTAEKLNRGAAYFGAKTKAMRPKGKLSGGLGMTEEQAEKYANDLVSKTQFKFNDIETPLALRSQVAKTLTQFQSFNIKQAEYLGGMGKGVLKGNPKDVARLTRWIGSNMALATVLGEVLGVEWYSSIPWNPAEFRGVEAPTVKVAKGAWNMATGRDQSGYETDDSLLERGKDFGANTVAPTLIPGGTQGRKTLQGMEAESQGASTTDAGRVRFLMPEQDFPGQSAIFGQYSNENAQEYFDREGKPLGDTASGAIMGSKGDDVRQEQMYDFYTTMQGQTTQRNAVSREVTDLVRQGKVAQATRRAREWNAEVDLMVADNFEKYGYDPDLEEALKEYKLSVESSRIKARKRD